MSERGSGLEPLYRAPLSDFLAGRKRLAVELKRAGQREEAERVAKLPKPTPAAWAVNQLLYRCPSDLDRLFALGAELRAVMRAGLAGGAPGKTELAGLEARQRELIATLASAAEAALAEQGGASDTVLARVKVTLTTLSLTGAWGAAQAGQLAKELDPPGVEQMAELLLSGGEGSASASGGADPRAAPRAKLAAAAGGPATAGPRAIGGPSPEELARRAAAAELARAEQRWRAAATTLQSAQAGGERAARHARQRADERAAAQAVVEALEGRLARARAELVAAEEAERAAMVAAGEAEASVEMAQREMSAATAELELRRGAATS